MAAATADNALQADKSASRRSIAFLNWAHALDHFVLLIYPTVVIGLEVIYQRPYAELIALSTAAFVAFGVFSLPAGWLADRWSRRNMMAVFYIGCGVSLVGVAASPNLFMLAIAMFALGVFAAIYHPVGHADAAGSLPGAGAHGRIQRRVRQSGRGAGRRRRRRDRVLARLARGFSGAGDRVHRHRRRLRHAGARRPPPHGEPQESRRRGALAARGNNHVRPLCGDLARRRSHLQHHLDRAAEDRRRAPWRRCAVARGRLARHRRVHVWRRGPDRGRTPG